MEEHCEFNIPYKLQDMEGACLEMAAVVKALEEAATQLFMKNNQVNIDSLILEHVSRCSTEQRLLMSEWIDSHHVCTRQ